MLTAEPVPGLHVAVTSRRSGDLGIHAPGVALLRDRLTAGVPVAWLSQVHGVAVADFTSPSPAAFGAIADAAVASEPGIALSVVTADCVPIALWSDDGAIGVVHAGWRGLLAGVIEAAVDTIRRRSRPGAVVQALVGPSIHAECYEFGGADLQLVADAYGDRVRGTTRTGAPALDMPAAVGSAFIAAGVTRWDGPDAGAFDACTACSDHWYSWRARRDTGRQALLVWRSA